MTWSRTLSLTLLLAAACCKAPAPAAPAAPVAAPLTAAEAAESAELDAVVQKALEGRPVPGVSVAVVHHGVTILAKGYGVGDVAAARPVAPDTIFRIGSITKSFTARTILALAAAGKLAVDDPLTKYLPDYDTKGKTITLRHLLTHTSGIKGYTEIEAFDQRQAEAFPRAELVKMFEAEPLEFEPGTKWAYSNSGYYLLGLVIEKVSGQPYADAVKALVIEPAGLAHTGYCPPAMSDDAHARGYQLVDGKVAPAAPLDMAHPYAAGSLCSTAGDLATWVAWLASDAAAWSQMTTEAMLTDGKPSGYGFGLGIARWEEHRRVAHGGGINGFVSQMNTYPDDELTVVVLTNIEGPAAPEVTEALARAALKIPEKTFVDLPITAEQAAPFAGNFDFPDIGLKFGVRYQNGKLEGANLDDKLTAPEPWLPLQWQGDLTFAAPAVKAVFTFVVENGRATGLHVVQRGQKIVGTRLPD